MSAGGTVTTTDSGWQNLVSNVQSMSVAYGVDTDGSGAPDTYRPIGSMTTAYW